MSEQICTATRQPIANVCMNRLQALADRATTVNDHVRGKLIPVSVSVPINPCIDKNTNTVAETWPLLFDSMRNAMDVIEAALDAIESNLDRAEI